MTSEQITIATILLLLPLATPCTIRQLVEPEVTSLEQSGSLNMSVHLAEKAEIKLGTAKGRLVFTRFFPNFENIKTEIDSLKITTHDGHSLPWILSRTEDTKISITFVLTSHSDLIVYFNYDVTIQDDHSDAWRTGCARTFTGVVFPIDGAECSIDGVNFTFPQTSVHKDCSSKFESSTNSNLSLSDPDAKTFQISLKCYGPDVCTCACKSQITDFCKDYLITGRLRSLFPPSWGNDISIQMTIFPFVFAVMTQFFHLKVFIDKPVAKYLGQLFTLCLGTSVFMMLSLALLVPVHVDTTSRACTAVYESEGGYFPQILFWTYFPYVITLLLATGFVENNDLIVGLNGRLKLMFFIYQIISPLCQVWLCLYQFVLPIRDALLLTGAIFTLTGLRVYFRNPLKHLSVEPDNSQQEASS